ncbi:MAG: hypothetical protein Q7S40_24120 [Opitutaceae bacterium]|nr:hypothetical protein [Opitutaceae bacterium]
MNRIRIKSASLLVIGLAAVAPLAAVEISLPTETAKLRESPLPGYGMAMGMCATCHSAEYMAYQPPSARTYWQATVTKMQKTFGAPIPDDMIAPLVDYLAKTYGTEKNAAESGKPAASTPSPAAGGTSATPRRN